MLSNTLYDAGALVRVPEINRRRGISGPESLLAKVRRGMHRRDDPVRRQTVDTWGAGND